MKKSLTFLVLITYFLTPWAQEDSSRVEGWDWVVLPSLSYNSDLGFKYGLYGNLFYYGRDSLCTYPVFKHKMDFELSRYTGKQTVVYLRYDGINKEKGLVLSATARYLNDPQAVFWGFNSLPLAVEQEVAKGYHLMSRRQLLGHASIGKRVTGKLYFYGGLTFVDYRTDYAKDCADSASNLYANYRERGLIHDDEWHGGSHLNTKVGLLYDTRNHPTIPSRGYSITAILTGSLDLGRGAYHHMKLSGAFSQFYPLRERAVVANRIAVQTMVAGEQPYYMLPSIVSTTINSIANEGLGGVNTLRGMPLCAYASNGIVWMNTEIRIRVFTLHLLKRRIDLGLNPFFDIGTSLLPYRLEEQRAAYPAIYDNINPHRLYCTTGLGGKLIVNQNFVLSAEAGILLNNPSGKFSWGINLCQGFLF